LKQCREFRKMIYDLYDDNLNETGKNELDAHLKICTKCLSFSKRVKHLKEALTSLPKVEVSENFNILLRERLRRELARQKQPVVKTKFFVPAFAVVVFLIIGLYSVNTFNILKRDNNTSTAERIIPNREYNTNKYNIQYVIDQYGVEESSIGNKSQAKNSNKNLSDTLKSIRNVDQIKARLTPVSF